METPIMTIFLPTLGQVITICALITGLILAVGPLIWITEKENKPWKKR